MRRASLGLVIALVAAACGGGSADDTTTTIAATTTTAAASTTAAPATTTTEAAPMRPVSMVAAPLDGSYHTGGTFDPAVMGADVGEVTAQWFSAEGFYVVVFDGFDADASDPLCPGASVELEGRAGFYDFVANAPAPGADCSAFPTLSEDQDVRALSCAGVFAFRSAIPAGTAGTLHASLERSDSGGIIGITSAAVTNGTDVPEIDIATLEC